MGDRAEGQLCPEDSDDSRTVAGDAGILVLVTVLCSHGEEAGNLSLGVSVPSSRWRPRGWWRKALLCWAWDGGGIVGKSAPGTAEGRRAQGGGAPCPALLAGPEHGLPTAPSAPWEGAQLCTWSLLTKTQMLRAKAGEGSGASGLAKGA